MSHFAVRSSAAVLIVLAAVLLPFTVAARPNTETVTAQVNITLPTGTAIIGTVVAKRTCGDTVTTDWSFNGMINGTQATASGRATERWLGDGREQIELTAIDTWKMPLAKPPLMTVNVVQTGPAIVTVNGIPAAVTPQIARPCSGVTSYVVTNAGQGTQAIRQLPNTASELPSASPALLIAMLLAGAGLLLAESRREDGR